MSTAATTFLQETPILMEALAQAVGTSPADAAEHIGGMVDGTLVEGYTVAEFVEQYGTTK